MHTAGLLALVALSMGAGYCLARGLHRNAPPAVLYDDIQTSTERLTCCMGCGRPWDQCRGGRRCARRRDEKGTAWSR